VKAGEDKGVLNGVSFGLLPFLGPLSRSAVPELRPEVRDREREVEGVTLETTFPRDEARRGKISSAITFTLGAQATTIAR
jgi:hypothetical protein